MRIPIHVALFLLIFSITAQAQVITPFSIWQQVTQRGDITFTGNSVLTCVASGTCTTAQTAVAPAPGNANSNYNNNNFNMVYNNIADAADVVSRFSRTNANLTLGTTGGCGVVYAELFWGGNVLSTTPHYSVRDSVYFKAPGATSYTGLKADILTDATIPFAGYYCYKDVTNIVKQAGSGTYWMANEVADVSGGSCGGWSLVVIYNDPTLPLRNLTIFRGIASINATPQDVTINGFFSPPSPAPVNIKLGVYSLEGDRGTLGDSLLFNGNPATGFQSVFDSKNPKDNAFNSTITNNTAEITRNPSYPNTLGVDEDIFVPVNSAYAYLPNSASSATLRMKTTGDVYAPFLISTAIDVFEPSIQVTKDVVDLNGGAVELGDTLKYILKVVNVGNDPATNVILNDSLYGAMNFVPGSIKINTGPNSGTKTDASGDDQANFSLVGGINFVQYRLGNGATATTGGKLGITAANDSVTTMEFKVTVTNDCQIFHCNPNLVNKAYATFVGNISGQGRSTYSSPTGFDAFGCPALGPTTLTVHVPPCTPPADTSISGCSPYPLSKVLPARPGYSQYFNSAFTSVTNATTSGVYYAIKQLYPGCNDTIQINMTINCVLPILLSDFKGSYEDNKPKLYWVTQQEINNKEFLLQRSVDGINYETIAIVPGAINSSLVNKYSYVDSNFPHLAKLFYRLSQVDLDRTQKLTSSIVLNIPDFISQSLSIYNVAPNPVKNIAAVSVLTTADANYKFTLYNSAAQKLFSLNKHLPKGQSVTNINFSNIAKGFYILEMQNQNNFEKTAYKLMVE